MKGETKAIVPMRYALRPAGTQKELRSQYDLFNCRLDTLTTKPTWRRLIGRQHVIFPFKKFYEWVEGPEGKPKLICFGPRDRDVMWAPGLYDTWASPDGKFTFQSLAIVTDDPPPEIAECGHDRCPVFLRKKEIDNWLTPESKGLDELMGILQIREPVHYLHEWAA